MDLVDIRPAWSMSGSEQLTTLDALHDEITRLETYRLHLLAGFDAGGHAKRTRRPRHIRAEHRELGDQVGRGDLSALLAAQAEPDILARLEAAGRERTSC